jgi:osmotically-inducible protein OsmY
MQMKKSLATVLMSAALLMPACSNWNRVTPKALDSTAIAEEVRKNMLADGITGLTVDVNNNNVVTLKGHLSPSDKQKAIADARKVHGVKAVVDEIAIQ